MFLILSSTHMTAMIRVQFREMKPEPNHSFYLLKPTWNHMWSGSGLGPVKPETKSSLLRTFLGCCLFLEAIPPLHALAC